MPGLCVYVPVGGDVDIDACGENYDNFDRFLIHKMHCNIDVWCELVDIEPFHKDSVKVLIDKLKSNPDVWRIDLTVDSWCSSVKVYDCGNGRITDMPDVCVMKNCY